MGLIFDSPLNRMEDVTLFTRHIAGAMNAGVPLPNVLRAFAAEQERSALTRSALNMADTVELGTPLSTAMESYPSIFPSAYRRMVKMGEQGRALGGVMDLLAQNMEKGLQSYEYFRRVAIYPLIILFLLVGIFSFLLMFIVPKLQDIYSQLGAQLPIPTQFVLSLTSSGVTQVVIGIVFIIPIAYLLGCVLGVNVRFTGYGRITLSLPLVGAVLRRMETSRFTGNLAMLLRAGVPMAEALGLLEDASSNTYVRDAVADFHRRYTAGEKLGDLIAAQPLFPASVAVMISSAEDKGALVDTLDALSKFYAERTVSGLTVLREIFEPLMLFFVGALVAFFVIALYLPMFNLPKSMGM